MGLTSLARRPCDGDWEGVAPRRRWRWSGRHLHQVMRRRGRQHDECVLSSLHMRASRVGGEVRSHGWRALLAESKLYIHTASSATPKPRKVMRDNELRGNEQEADVRSRRASPQFTSGLQVAAKAIVRRAPPNLRCLRFRGQLRSSCVGMGGSFQAHWAARKEGGGLQPPGCVASPERPTRCQHRRRHTEVTGIQAATSSHYPSGAT